MILLQSAKFLGAGAIAAISIIFVCIKCYKTKSSDTEDKFLEEDDNNNQSSDDKDDKLIIMLFYADWCGHCTAQKPYVVEAHVAAASVSLCALPQLVEFPVDAMVT